MSAKGWLNSLINCMARECAIWLRTPGELFFCAALPILWMLIVWGLLGDGVMTRVPVGFVDEDKSSISREIARAVQANRAFGLVDFSSAGEALKAMRAGKLYGVLVVPFGYSRDMLTGRGSSISLYVDENRYAVAGTLEAEMSSIATALGTERVFNKILQIGDGTAGANRIISIVHSDFYALGNMQFSFLAFLGAALMPGVIMVGAMLGFVTAILREDWNKSISSWLASARGSFSAALLGKLLPHYALYCLIFLFYMAVFCGQGGFAPAGSLFIWFACGAACLAVFLSMAVLFTAIAPNWRLALVLASGYAAPALPFTGFSIPLESMGEYVRAFAHCLPLSWLIQGQAQQWTLGADLAHTSMTFTALFLLCVIPAIPGFLLFRHVYDRKGARETGSMERAE